MGLANFFGKNALSAHQVLGGMTPESFSRLLSAHVVAIAFDESAAQAVEGRITVELATNLAARLYPRLRIQSLSEDVQSNRLAEEMRHLAAAINPEIEIVDSSVVSTITVAVGRTPVPEPIGPVIYAGSEAWEARISTTVPVGSGASDIPFGGAAAACFALANVFRFVFGAHLPRADLDTSFNLSLLDYTQADGPRRSDALAKKVNVSNGIDLGETCLAGVGAIGNAAVWTLARVAGLRGVLHLVDDQVVALSNLQRYVLTTQEHASNATLKVDLAAQTLKGALRVQGSARLRVVEHGRRWGAFLAARADWRIERVATAFDTVPDRIAAQAALPRVLLNAWTQIGNLGVSRHLAFGQTPCVACTYPPKAGGKSEAELIGEVMGFPGAPAFIREMLHAGEPVGEEFIYEVARRRGITRDEDLAVLLEFQSSPLRSFYSDAFCGGIVLTLSGSREGPTARAEAPMAFQSALAGVMLAAEIVIDAGALRARCDDFPVRTCLDLLRPIAPYLHEPVGRRPQCLCSDRDFLESYQLKYQTRAVATE